MADFRPVNLAEVYGAADQANMNRMRMDAYQRQAQQEQTALDQQKALKGAYAIGPDGELDEKTTLANLYRVAPEKAYEFKQGVQKSKIEMADAQSKQAKSALEQNAAVLKYGRDRLAQVTNQQEYDAWVGEMNQIGAPFAKSLSPQYSPETQQKYLLTADDALKQATPKYERVDLGGKIQVIDVNPFTNPAVRNMQLDKTQTPDSIASTKQQELNRGVTIRGQNMTDARAKEANRSGKAPAGYTFNADGTLAAIPGGPADKALNPTESQGKSALFSSRALEADKTLRSLDGKYSPVGINTKLGIENTPLIGGMMAPIANAALSPESQQAEQAQRDFINAVLRQESGAVIGESEFENARKQYFPQPGDSKQVIDQKARNRQTAIRGLNSMAGPLGKKNSGATGGYGEDAPNVIDFGSLK